MEFQPVHCLTLLLCALLSLQVKHFFADYVWQTKYMLRKTAKKDWQLPLLAHAAVHAALTGLVLAPIVGINAIAFALIDLCIHFLVDYWKAQFTEKNPFNKKFWVAFGLDQLAHQLTYIALAFLAVTMAMK